MITHLAFLLLLSSFYGWRYSKVSADPDWCYFNLYAFTGSMYGRDFPDCKTPVIHVWYWFLSKVVGKSVPRIKFANHFLISVAGIGVYLLTNNIWMAISYLVLINSGWLLTFHGNVGQLSAMFLVFALLTPPAISTIFWILAVLTEPKLLLAFVIYSAIHLWWWVLPIGVVSAVLIIYLRRFHWFELIFESSVVMPMRIQRQRVFRKEEWMPWWSANAVLYVFPWIVAAVVSNNDWLYWVPPIAFLLVTLFGKVVRPNHIIPLAAWFVASSISPLFIVLLSVYDFVGGGFYLGNIWLRFYPYISISNKNSEECGLWLKDKPGTLYVNDMHTGIYLYSQKPIPYGMSEELELRDVAIERSQFAWNMMMKHLPDWIVVGEFPGRNLKLQRYVEVNRIGGSIIYGKGVNHG